MLTNLSGIITILFIIAAMLVAIQIPERLSTIVEGLESVEVE